MTHFSDAPDRYLCADAFISDLVPFNSEAVALNIEVGESEYLYRNFLLENIQIAVLNSEANAFLDETEVLNSEAVALNIEANVLNSVTEVQNIKNALLVSNLVTRRAFFSVSLP